MSDVFGAVFTHDGDKNLCVADVTTDFHGGDGHQTDARVFDFTTDQLGQLTLHLVANALGTAVVFCHLLLPVTDQRANPASLKAANARPDKSRRSEERRV